MSPLLTSRMSELGVVFARSAREILLVARLARLIAIPASGKELEGDVFFEENPMKILLSLIAMAEAGIFMQGLI